MSRYGKYFLQHLLWLEDSFCQDYVQVKIMYTPMLHKKDGERSAKRYEHRIYTALKRLARN